MLSSKKMERDLMVDDDGISSRLALLVGHAIGRMTKRITTSKMI